MLAVLIEFHQAGEVLAGRVLLQEFLPNLVSLPRGHWVEDQFQLVVAEFWNTISRHDLAKRPVASNLVLNTINAFCRGRNVQLKLHEHEVAHGAILPSYERANGSDDQGAADADVDLQVIVDWGLRRDVINQMEADIVMAALGVTSGRRADVAAAARVSGLSMDAAKQRCSRAKRRLVEAVRAELREDATALTRAS